MSESVGDLNLNQLGETARSLLGDKYFLGLKKWYLDAVRDNDDSIIVFIVRRSYILALIFEIITGVKLEQKDKFVLTDASLILACKKLAEYYRQNGHFPKIRLVDDLYLHGLTQSYLMSNFERTLIRLLSPRFDKKEIQQALVSALDIQTYAGHKNGVLFNVKYKDKFIYTEPLDMHECMNLSMRISQLVSASGIVNATYTLPKTITKDEFVAVRDKLKADTKTSPRFIATWYRGIKEYAQTRFFRGANGEIVAIATIRLLLDEIKEEFHVVPFVLLPEMSHLEKERIKVELGQRIFPMIGNEGRRYFNLLSDISNERVENEVWTLVMSSVLLHAFFKEAGLPERETTNAELDKVLRHIFMARFDKPGEAVKSTRDIMAGYKEQRNVLKKLADDEFITIEDLEEILARCIKPGKVLKEFLFTETVRDFDEENEVRRIRDNLDDYFYAYDYVKEKRIVKDRRSSIVNREMPETLPKNTFEIFHSVSKWVPELKTDRTYMEVAVALFLQQMDAGVVSVNSLRQNSQNRESNKGYCQYAKAGEMALPVHAFRNWMYIGMLSQMEDRAHIRERQMRDVMQEFFAQYSFNATNRKKDLMIKKGLCRFVDHVEAMNQHVGDWDLDYIKWIQDDRFTKMEDFDVYSMDTRLRNMEKGMKIIRWREKYIHTYIEYLLEGIFDVVEEEIPYEA